MNLSNFLQIHYLSCQNWCFIPEQVQVQAHCQNKCVRRISIWMTCRYAETELKRNRHTAFPSPHLPRWKQIFKSDWMAGRFKVPQKSIMMNKFLILCVCVCVCVCVREITRGNYADDFAPSCVYDKTWLLNLQA